MEWVDAINYIRILEIAIGVTWGLGLDRLIRITVAALTGGKRPW